MKRRLTILLLLTWVLLAVCGSALADSVTYDAVNDMLTVRCNACAAGGEYSLLVLRDGASLSSLSAGDLLFIDQLTADQSGVIEAAFIDPQFPVCSVYAGGTFTSGSSPRTLGNYSPIPEHPFDAPVALAAIETEAFMGSRFTHVYLSENVTTIGSKAFADCADLIYIYIPAMNASIASNAFSGCSGFTIGCRAGSTAQQYAIDHGYAYRVID